MKKKYGIILVVFAMLFISCGKNKIHSCNDEKVKVGNLISIDLIPLSFNESITHAGKAKIKTTTHLFIVYGIPSGNIGDPVWQCSHCNFIAITGGGQWLITNHFVKKKNHSIKEEIK